MMTIGTTATADSTPTPDNSPGSETLDLPAGQPSWILLQYFNVYRTGLATLATIGSFFTELISPFGQADPDLFRISAVTYFIISLFGLRITYLRQPDFETQASVFAFADVTFVSLLIHASGGLASSLGLFLVVAVAGASLLLDKRMTIFVAALASVAALIQHSWGLLTGTESYAGTISQGYPQVGALGVGLFTAAALGFTLAKRLRISEDIARKRGADLTSLGKINSIIIERMESAVMVCDDDCQVTQHNSQAQHFFGLKENETFRLADTSPELQRALESWIAFPGRQAQQPIQSSNGITLVPRFSYISDNKEDGIIIFLSDVATLKQQAQQLKMAALARLTASIAHEIRNPLGAISNAAQLLNETSANNPEDARLAQIITDHCKRMNIIIENITQLARRDRLHQEKTNISEWLENFAARFIEEKQLPAGIISISGDSTIEACIDPNQMNQVLTNLVENGIRHSPVFSGKAAVELDIRITDTNQPCLVITDHGEGIPPEIAENIFDPFFTTASTGTGLGLYISRELCESNGGGLQYVSSYTEGAQFRIIFSSAEECH